jgi:hypothetical protein
MEPASVPVPLPVVQVRVDGVFTALDRKMWLVLLHHAWDDIEKGTYIHSISMAEVQRLFRRFGRHAFRGSKSGEGEVSNDEDSAAVLWNSVYRLVGTRVTWADEEYQGVSALLASAMMSKKHRATGWLNYTFGELLARKFLAPRMYARLRIHVMMQLRGKYAVTLYEILEGYVNRRDNTCTVDLDELQRWLKVPKNAYPDWRELKKRVIVPAVEEINDNCDEAGFIVTYEGIREGKSFKKIKFTVVKTAARDDRDALLQNKADRSRQFTAPAPAANDTPYQPPDYVLENMRTLAPGWDRQALIARFNEWKKGKEIAANPDGAFVGWVKKFTKQKRPH